MNKKPIEEAQDPDLRSSKPALIRAAQRAREIAIKTDTYLIVSHNGVIEKIKPTASIQESTTLYVKK